jgi:Phage tail lysozyme
MMAGNVKAESNFNPNEVGDHGTSFGLAQWHNDRRGNLKKFAGDRDTHDVKYPDGFPR